MADLYRGDIWYIKFPYTLDPRYPEGKKKFVVVLQEGDYFRGYDTITVLLTTSDETEKDYSTSVTIPKGSTKLSEETYIICAQPHTIPRRLFDQHGTWCAGHLEPDKMIEVDAAVFEGLCMGQPSIKDL